MIKTDSVVTVSCRCDGRWTWDIRCPADRLFDKILLNKQHLLRYLLSTPSAASQSYNTRRRLHNKLLPQHQDIYLMDSNFIIACYIKYFVIFIMTILIYSHFRTDTIVVRF